nr:type VI secretion system-associated FHA domain protein TagH [uncultured Desulfobacter sp.]
MQLRIKVLTYKGRPPQRELSVFFDKKSGTIGRSPDNDLHLTDPDFIVSSKHASIVFDDNSYYIEDHSTNGSFFLDTGHELRNSSHSLKNGDKLEIGNYVLEVSISDVSDHSPHAPNSITFFTQDNGAAEDHENEQSPSSSPFSSPPDQDNEIKPPGVFDSGITTAGHYDPPSIAADVPEEQHPEPRDPFPLTPPDNFNPENLLASLDEPILSDSRSETSTLTTTTASLFSQSQFDDGFDLLEKDLQTDDAGAIPDVSTPSQEKLKEVGNIRPKSIETPRQETEFSKSDDTEKDSIPSSDMAEEGNELIAIFLEALGIKDEKGVLPEEIPEFMQTVGTVLKELADGLRAVLWARAESKGQITGITKTMIEIKRNNPLKFSPTVEDALKLMLLDKRTGFMDAVSAVREGYEDVKKHQLAVNAGVQATLQKLLNHLDPQNFEKQYEKKHVMKNKYCWEAYKNAYNDIVKETPKKFFDHEFAKAYKELVSRIEDVEMKS